MFAFQMVLIAGVVWMCHVMSRAKNTQQQIRPTSPQPDDYPDEFVPVIGMLAGSGFILHNKYRAASLPVLTQGLHIYHPAERTGAWPYQSGLHQRIRPGRSRCPIHPFR